MNKKVLWIVGGCAVLLLLCCVVMVVGYVVVWPSIQQQILGTLGTSMELPLGTIVPALPSIVPPAVGKITPGTVPTKGALPTAGASSSRASSAATGTGNPFTDALGKAKSATKYRMEFIMTTGAMQNGKFVETPVMNLTGEVDGQNSHIAFKGGMFGGAVGSGMEIIEAQGKTYMLGLLDSKTWYITDDTTSGSFSSLGDLAKPDNYSSFTGGKNTDFKKTGSESLDSQTCDVYSYDMKSVWNASYLGAFGALGASPDAAQFNAVDQAEFKAWLCPDGYVHKYALNYQAHSSKDATQKTSFQMNGHTWDFGGSSINIQPPKDAKAMPK